MSEIWFTHGESKNYSFVLERGSKTGLLGIGVRYQALLCLFIID